MMQHATDDELILNYYGDGAQPVDAHLRECAECRGRYRELQSVMNVVDIPVPERAATYESDVWTRLAPKLPLKSRRPAWVRSWRWFAAVAMASLVIGAFIAGRMLPRNGPAAPETAGVRERVLVVAVGDHLERSQVLLAELVNAEKPDFVAERERAELLLGDNRLYRTAASARGDVVAASVLEDLERVLMDIVNSPEAMGQSDLNAIRERVEREGLVFKIRVVGSRYQGEAPQI
jgi:hypothetical protein